MTYWTLISYRHFAGHEQRRYVRVNGKIPLWQSEAAARYYRDFNGMRRDIVFVKAIEISKPGKNHRILTAMGE